MNKGLLFTLLAISFALVQVTNSYATAPIVSDAGDIIIGDLENATNPATGTNIFVYSDAIAVDSLVLDDATPDDEIKWSFLDTTGRIEINGVSSLNASLSGLNADDPTSPRASSRLDLNDNDPGEPGPPNGADPAPGTDGNPRTFTLRNVDLSPNNSTANFSDAELGTGVIDAGDVPGDQTTVITLFASDCSTFTSSNITVFSFNNTSDAISMPARSSVVGPFDFTVNSAISLGWIGAVLANGSNSAQVFDDGDGVDDPLGMCMTTNSNAATIAGAGGDTSAWLSPDPYWDLADNTIYLITLDVTHSQTNPGEQPFWDVTITGPNNLYGSQNWILDISGFANAVQPGGSSYFFAFAPLSVNMPRWKAALNDPALDDLVDPTVLIRVTDGNTAILAQDDSGTLCVVSLTVQSVSRDSLVVDAVELNAPLDPSTHFAELETGIGSIPFFPAGGPITYTMDTTGDIDGFGTNDRHTFGWFDATAGASVDEQLFPAVWQAQTLYRGKLGVVATNGTDITDAPDALFMNGDPANATEIGTINFVTRGAGAPVLGITSPGAQAGVYETYFYSQKGTADPTANKNRLRFTGQWSNTNVLFADGNGGDQVDVTSFEFERLISP